MEDRRAKQISTKVPSGSACDTGNRVLKEILSILEHTAAFIAAILSIWSVHFVLESLLGHDARFFDLIPVGYVIDAGHLAVLLRYLLKLTLQIWADD